MPRTRSPSSPAYTSSASPSPRPDRLAPPVPTTSSTIFSGVEPGPPATDTAPDRHTRMPKSAAKRRQPRRLPPLTSPMKHRGERGWERRVPPDAECGTGNSCDGSRDENAQEPSVQNRAVDRLERAHECVIIYTSEAGNDGAGEYEERSCEQIGRAHV